MIRKGKPSANNQGGVTKVYLYKVSQFTVDVEWPLKSNIVAGKLAAMPTIALASAARIIFDIKEGKPKSTGNTSATNYGYLHALEGKVAGYTTEKYTGVEEFEGEDIIAVAVRPNGDRIVFGQTYKPLRMEISDDLGTAGDSYVGSDIKFTQTDVVDFRPPLLDAAVVITSTAVVAYV